MSSDSDSFAPNVAIAKLSNRKPEEKKKKKKHRKKHTPSTSSESVSQKPPAAPMPDAVPGEDDQAKAYYIRAINEMRDKLNAIGTGMVPSTKYSLESLKAELDLLNSEVDQGRGNNAMKSLMCDAIAPALEYITAATVPKEQLDLEGLPAEVRANWNEVFHRAAMQIAINHPYLFSVGPVTDMLQGMAGCAASRNAKNQMRRMRERGDAQRGLATDEALSEEAARPYHDGSMSDDPDEDFVDDDEDVDDKI